MAARGLGKNRSNDKARPGKNGASTDRPIGRLRSFRVNGPLLRSLRLARGWTQQDAADKAGMTDRFIRKAETGQPLELKSVSLLAQLYSTPEAPLKLEQLLIEPLGDFLEDGNGGEALVRRWFDEVWNQGRLETIEELTTPKSVLHADGAMLRGSAQIRRRTEAIRAAFSDFDLRMEHVTVHGDWVVARWHVAMTHTGDWMGNKPTGERVTAHGSTWIRVEDGAFVEGWDFWEEHQATDAVRRNATAAPQTNGRRHARKRKC